jgi:hypothetical protein
MRRIAGGLMFLAVGSAAPDPDFTGAWKLNVQESEIRPSVVEPSREIRIDHQGTKIRCVAVLKQGEGPVALHYAIDGKEARHKAGGREMKSILKWEGVALLINTLIMSAEGQYTQMDRWKLSRDGKTLTIRRHIVRLHGETESTLIYEKQ